MAKSVLHETADFPDKYVAKQSEKANKNKKLLLYFYKFLLLYIPV